MTLATATSRTERVLRTDGLLADVVPL